MKVQDIAAIAAIVSRAHAAPAPYHDKRADYEDSDPFAILDEQSFVMPQNVSWEHLLK